MNPGVSGKLNQWWTWREPCKRCKTLITYIKGIFCGNFSASRGNWKPCHKGWCAPIFKPLEGDRFPTSPPKDEDGNLLVNKEGAERFCVARTGDHFFVSLNVNSAISEIFRGDRLCTEREYRMILGC
jgi:hypothetical protein